MKFAKNGLYIESYIKCTNCGILIYETSKQAAMEAKHIDGEIYCSSWCIDWETDRRTRLGAQENAH